jgi:hypothetical protein
MDVPKGIPMKASKGVIYFPMEAFDFWDNKDKSSFPTMVSKLILCQG